MLGLEARHGRPIIDPNVPEEIGRVYISHVPGFGQLWDVEAVGTKGHVRLAG